MEAHAGEPVDERNQLPGGEDRPGSHQGAFSKSTVAADAEHIDAFDELPGFGSGGVYTSAWLVAWDTERFGVYDRFGNEVRAQVVVPACSCYWKRLAIYEEHLRVMADELAKETGDTWWPRHVDMALYELGWEANERVRLEALCRRRAGGTCPGRQGAQSHLRPRGSSSGIDRQSPEMRFGGG